MPTGTPITTVTFALISLATLRTLMGYSASMIEDDTRLQAMIYEVTELIQTLCDRKFEITTYTEYQDGNGTNEIVLENRPINSITSIHDDVDRAFGDTTLLESTEYVFYEEEGIVRILPGQSIYTGETVFAEGIQNVKVVYSAGYSTDNIPKDLEMIAAETIMKKFKNYKSQTVGQSTVSSGGVNVSFSKDDISEENKSILFSKYRG